MPLTLKELRMVIASCAVPLLAVCSTSFAQVATEQGMSTVPYSGRGVFGEAQLTVTDKQSAIEKAEANAIDYYFANQGAASSGNYQLLKGQIDSDVSKYVLSYVVLDQNDDKKSKSYSVTLRANINAAALAAVVAHSSATATTATANRSYLMFVFVSRQVASSKTFDPHVYKRVDVKGQATGSAESNVSGDSHVASKGSQGQSISDNHIGVSEEKRSESMAHASATGKSSAEASTVVETGGSVEHRSTQFAWQIFPSANIDTAVTSVMTQAGYNPVSEAFVEPYTNGLLKISEIDSDYSSGNDLSPSTLQHIVAGARIAKIRYVALGTLDMGQMQTNPATGLLRVGVTVNARVLDVLGMFPRQIAAVGPVQYFGNGPTEISAETTALSESGKSVAEELTSQMQAAGFH